MTRRANGESTIYKDEQGRWHGQVSLGRKENGERDRRHVSGKTRAEVVARVRGLEQKRDAGITQTAGRPMTVGDWLDHWLTISKRSVRVKTYVGYESYVRNHIAPALGHHRLDKLQPEHLEAFYTHLADEKGLSSAMQLQQHRVISRALKIAMQRGRVARNVATLVAAPTLKRTEVVRIRPRRLARFSLPPVPDATRLAGQSPSRWACARARRWGPGGTSMSTSKPRPGGSPRRCSVRPTDTAVGPSRAATNR